jgi:hypothetical protein
MPDTGSTLPQEPPRFALGPGPAGPLPFCERCGRLVGAVTSVARAGLRTCPSCGLYACVRCWEIASGACPGCLVTPAARVTPSPMPFDAPARPRVDAGPGREAGPAAGAGVAPALPPPRRPRRLALVAAGMSVAVIAIGALSSLAPTGQVAGATGTPGVADAAQGGVGTRPAIGVTEPGAGSEQASGSGTGPPASAAGLASKDGSTGSGGAIAPGQTNGTDAPPAGEPSASPQLGPTPEGSAPSTQPPTPATPVPVTPAPSATVTPTPTAAPTPTPTPSSTPTPTPEPTPTPAPDCVVVPDLAGLTVADARIAWSAAGFTGAFSPAFGQNNKTVLTQSQPAGACLASTASISVTYAP